MMKPKKPIEVLTHLHNEDGVTIRSTLRDWEDSNLTDVQQVLLGLWKSGIAVGIGDGKGRRYTLSDQGVEMLAALTNQNE